MSKRYVLREESDEGWGGLIILAVIFTIIGGIASLFTKLYEVLIHWQEHTFINKIIAGIYYYIIVIPIKFVIFPFTYSKEIGLTQFDNLNLVIGCLGTLVAFIILIWAFRRIISFESKKNPSFSGLLFLFALYTVPFIVWLISLVFKWLFA